MLKTGTLIHGGVMVNYKCVAACRHCLYSCSPTRVPSAHESKETYVNEASAEKICRLLYSGGCRSVHIGGGEPFLDFDGLLMMVRKLKSAGIKLEYIETNAYWAANAQGQKAAQKGIMAKLKSLLKEGADCLCISIDPFHAEYIPYSAPLALMELCEKAGMNFFLWKPEFLSALSRLDSKKTHSRAEMEKILSKTYVLDTARLYGIEYGGRAVNVETEFGALYHAETFTADDAPCRNLLSTGHFHVDMDCHFIPPRCTGIHIPLSEAVEGIPPGKYPAFEALYFDGVSALLELALQYGFSPDGAGYPSKCNSCFHLRHFLSEKDFAELDRNHYEEALRYY